MGLRMKNKDKTDRSCEPAHAYLVHEVREALAGLQLVLPQHVLGQLGGEGQGGEEEQDVLHSQTTQSFCLTSQGLLITSRGHRGHQVGGR